jgi:hypothetical protein
VLREVSGCDLILQRVEPGPRVVTEWQIGGSASLGEIRCGCVGLVTPGVQLVAARFSW